MGTITLDYSMMGLAESNAKKSASACESYIRKIQGKVTKKLDALERGVTSNTASSNYFAQQKIASLNRKHDQYIKFADKVNSVKTCASDTDKRVSSYIRSKAVSFRKEHDMSVNVIVEWFAWVTTTLINKTEFGRWIAQAFREVGAWVKDKARDFKRWYYLEGGKYIINTVVAVIGTVIAVAALFFVALPALVTAVGTLVAAIGAHAVSGAILWTAISAAASFATAIIAVGDGMAKIYGNVNAYLMNDEDPGWAQRYGGYDSYSDFLRKSLFSTGWANKMSYIAANAYEFVTIAATTINLADTARQGIRFLQTIKEKGVSHIFNKIHFKGKGKMTWETFKYGIKRSWSNLSILKDGVTNTNISRLNSFYKQGKFLEKVWKVEKVNKSIEKTMKFYDKINDNGAFKASFDKGVEKLREKTVFWDGAHNIKDLHESIQKQMKNLTYGHAFV